ncbi:MAG: YidC/Oxa1 family membrane protein insertase [Bacillota bacterium]
MLNWLGSIMEAGLRFFYGIIPNWSVAIILLTIAIRVVLLPLTVSQMRSSQIMAKLQPKIKEIQEKYKKDPTRLNLETQNLWRENKVNPFSGCLLTLIQFPFLIAFFQMLRGFDFGGAGFLWVKNLAQPDPYVLPILAAVTSYWQMKVATPSQDPSTRWMNFMFPVLIGWMSRSFAAGLTLYWVVSNLFTVAQQFVMPAPVRKTEGAKS